MEKSSRNSFPRSNKVFLSSGTRERRGQRVEMRVQIQRTPQRLGQADSFPHGPGERDDLRGVFHPDGLQVLRCLKGKLGLRYKVLLTSETQDRQRTQNDHRTSWRLS